jgi:hypothetical protein
MKFKEQDINTKKKTFKIFEVEFNNLEIKIAIKQAELKSKHTNNVNQNGENRTDYKKFVKQFQGVLGEMAIREMLFRSFKREDGCNMNIIRWDDVRTDGFKSAENEYDILIENTSNNFYVESRASVNYKFSFTEDTLINMDTIGKYSNLIKKKEKKSDFYIRPLFQLINPERNYTLDSFDFYELFMEGGIILYITGGCSKEMMYGKNSEIKSMGQNNAEYQTLSIIKGWDVQELLINMKFLVCGEENKL